MIKLIQRNLTAFITYSTVVVTLVVTPFFNKDALIVPKVTLIIIMIFVIIPILVVNFSQTFKFYKRSYFLLSSSVLVFLLVLIVLNSSSPIEQQLYGRGGRGLGVFTILLSYIILISISYFGDHKIMTVIKGLSLSSFLSSSYALLQSYGVDFYQWETRTNGVIGTLGNPNFQASFAAMAYLPTLFFVWKKNWIGIVNILLVSCFYLIVLIRNNSTQGYIGFILGLVAFFVIFTWYQNKLAFWSVSILSIFIAVLTFLGMVNKGPFSSYFYKISIQSRGDFWRSAIDTAQSNPLLGVGIDSFGDFYLKYRDQIAISHPWAEYTDNAHNYYLEFAATGGFLLAILLVLLQLYTLFCVYSYIKHEKVFDPKFAVIVSAWLVYLAQSIISPGNVAIILWGAIVSACIIAKRIGLNFKVINTRENFIIKPVSNILFIVFLVPGILSAYPYFKADQLQLRAMNSGNGDLAIKSAKMFPESTTRYATIIRGLYDSGLYVEALELSRHAVKFNPNSANLWAFILINPKAPFQEREYAKLKIIDLDPLNEQTRNFKILDQFNIE